MLVHHVEKGSRMLISGFTGPYHLPDNVLEKTDHLVHITAGSGSVPNWSMLKHAVKFIPQLRHTFIYSNKTWDDIIFRDALNAFCARAPRQGPAGALPHTPGRARRRARPAPGAAA